MTLLLLALGSAQTAHAAYYHPDQVAAASAVFVSSAEKMAPAFEAAQKELGVISIGLERLELGVTLLGSTVAEADRAHFEAARRRTAGEFLQTQQHVDVIQEGFGAIFSAALERALAAETEPLVECGVVAGIASLLGNKPKCEGEDANPRLAARLDADTELTAAVTELLGRPWPALTRPSAAMQVVPLTGAESWVDVSAIARRFIPDAIERHRDDLDRALAPLEGTLDEAATREAASRLRDDYERRMAADGQILSTALTGALERAARKGHISGGVGLCPNPPGLGGCGGEEVTADVLAVLAEDRRFAKATDMLK